MVNKIVTFNDTDGILLAGAGNFIGVMPGVSVTTELAGNAIDLADGGSAVHVHGTVTASAGIGISTGHGTGPGGASKVIVGDGGIVSANGFAAIRMENGLNLVLNDGGIYATGSFAVSFEGDNNTIVNNGVIMGSDSAISFSATNASTNILDNFGTILATPQSGSAVTSLSGIDLITNRGTMSGGVDLFNGNDAVDNVDGLIDGLISFGSGDDFLLGGARVERAMGGSGSDTMEFDAGRDVFLAGNNEEAATDDNDDLDGGDGVDTYDASGISSALNISLQELRAAGNAIGIDLVLNFENVIGGTTGDTLTGDGVRNVIDGRAGADTLTGLAGNDKLLGGANGDTLIGGTGRDVLVGGLNADVFDFNSTAETGTTAETRDIIRDFAAGLDDIDLSTIDADTVAGGNQAFTFIGAAAFGAIAGELRATVSATFKTTIVEGDTNGDGKADFQIQLNGNPAVAAGDFIL